MKLQSIPYPYPYPYPYIRIKVLNGNSVAVAVDCELEVGVCSFVKQLKVEEGDGEACGYRCYRLYVGPQPSSSNYLSSAFLPVFE